MAWTAPIQHAVGDVLPAADWNTYVANNEIALENSLQLISPQGSVVGTNLPVGAPNFKIQAGTTVVTTNTGGNFTVTYPIAFPNSVVTFIPVMGDNGSLTSAAMTIENYALLASQGAVAVNTTNGAVVASTTLRFNWLAIGS